MSSLHASLGASRPPVRRAPRSGALPLFISDWSDIYRLHREDRQPGDEALLVVTLSDQAGAVHTCADCRDYHECDCPEFARDGFDCRHLRALTSQEVFGHVTRWAATATPKRGA